MPQATKYRKDYQAPSFWIDTVYLQIELQEDITTVTNTLKLRRNPGATTQSLTLNGTHQTLISVSIDGVALNANDYQLTESELTFNTLPDTLEMVIVSTCKPQENKALEGLFKSQDMYCTQCEAEGFRRITYMLDRPDVLATYTTHIIADKKAYPILLSNGNRIDSGDLDHGRHFVTWQDPFKKPCYLFAAVAGNLAVIKDNFTTISNREVALELYTRPNDIEHAHHAMACLKQSMHWDEQRFGREYDLDIYMIVAVEDFNMGAMENKGLNVFNTKYVLADTQTATDLDFENVQRVIGHEYFHNWSGNRVTVRDWFQLSLKEGLTVFRDQEFTSDLNSRPIKRIEDVKIIRSAQFAEDSSPMAHPIRPDSYIEMNNFYTVTVYNKGAEVIRMMHTLVGESGFRKGLDRYFEKFDGQAVTCNDFVDTIEQTNQCDLSQFRLWYSQAGTPELNISDAYDANNKQYTLIVKQHTPSTPGQEKKLAMHIPLKMSLLNADGNLLPLKLKSDDTPATDERVLSITQAEQVFVFENVDDKPTPSLLHDFSAPVKLNFSYTEQDLAQIVQYSPNTFTRWDASQQLASQLILQQVEQYSRLGKEKITLSDDFITAMRHVLNNPTDSPEFIAIAMGLPSLSALAQMQKIILVDELHCVRKKLVLTLAQQLQNDLMIQYNKHHNDAPYIWTPEEAGRRALKNVCLTYLSQLNTPETLALSVEQFKNADNMTEQLAALHCLVNCDDLAARETAISDFYYRWQDNALVIDKWLSIQALADQNNTPEAVDRLLAHPAFTLDNPNKVYALIGGFTANLPAFHRADGAGYALLTNVVKQLDSVNPSIAARIVRALMNWHRYDDKRQALQLEALENLAKQKLSPNTYEVVSKSLALQKQVS